MTKKSAGAPSAQDQNQRMERYYRLQSKIYNATRWSFLFGRRRIIQELPIAGETPLQILEIGCGTGFNTEVLARRFPKARIQALDVSSSMVELAQKRTASFGERVQILHQPYEAGSDQFRNWPDLILFSYSLTMINPQWQDLLRQAVVDLRPGGHIAVVDFHDSRMPWFKQHMSNHHVRMDGHLLPVLNELFEPVKTEVRPAYLGIWHYLFYQGRKAR